MAMPTTASMPAAWSRSISSRVVMPPAAVRRRDVASRTARMASMSVPSISPSLSTCVYRNSPHQGSSARTASTAVTGVASRQPLTTTRPPLLSTAAMIRSEPTAEASAAAKSGSGRPSRNSDEPTMTAVAPWPSTARARSMVRIPPPTRHASRGAIDRTSASLVPEPIAASRSMTCTRGKSWNFRTQPSMSSEAMAGRSPWMSCTTCPPFRSMEGISTSRPRSAPSGPSAPGCRGRGGAALGRPPRAPRSERWTPRAPRPPCPR